MPGPGLQIYTHEFFPKRGGIASYCHEFANAAASMGYEVCLHAPKSATAGNESADYSLIPGKASGNHSMRSIWQTSRLLRKTLADRPDDLHLLAEPGPILALGRLSEKQIGRTLTIATLHGSEINLWQNRGFRQRHGPRALARVKGIRTVSNPIHHLTTRAFPEWANKAKAVPNALPTGFAERSPHATEDSQAESDPKFHILSVGRIHRRKGFDQMIKAIGLLPKKTRDQINYTVAGGRKDEGYLQEIQQLAVQNNVDLNLQIDLSDAQLADCYRGANLFALTSLPYKKSIEGFGLVYLEAGAHGLPCIGYDTGGVSDAIRDGETGRLIQSGDIDALSHAIDHLFNHADERLRLGRNNRQFALSRTWCDVVRETLEINT